MNDTDIAHKLIEILPAGSLRDRLIQNPNLGQVWQETADPRELLHILYVVGFSDFEALRNITHMIGTCVAHGVIVEDYDANDVVLFLDALDAARRMASEEFMESHAMASSYQAVLGIKDRQLRNLALYMLNFNPYLALGEVCFLSSRLVASTLHQILRHDAFCATMQAYSSLIKACISWDCVEDAAFLFSISNDKGIGS